MRRAFPIAMAFFLWAPTALADARSEAEAFHKQGVELMQKRKFAEASAAFRASYAKDQSPRELYNAARAELAQGKNAEAARLYRTYLSLPQNDKMAASERAEATQELADITKSLCTLDVRASSFTVDGQAYDRGLADVEPGEHKVEMQGADGLKVKVVNGVKGTTILVEYTEPTKGSGGPGPVAPPREEMERGSWVVPGIFGAAGVIGLGVGIGLGAASAGADSDAKAQVAACTTANPWGCSGLRAADNKISATGVPSIIAYVGGGVFLGAAVVAALIEQPWRERPVRRVTVVPGLGGASVVGTF